MASLQSIQDCKCSSLWTNVGTHRPPSQHSSCVLIHISFIFNLHLISFSFLFISFSFLFNFYLIYSYFIYILSNDDAAHHGQMWELIDPLLRIPFEFSFGHGESLKVAQGSALVAMKLDLFPPKHSNCNMSL